MSQTPESAPESALEPTEQVTEHTGHTGDQSNDSGGQTTVLPATSYEQARDELAEVVANLEAGGTSLEEALRLWERGEELARVCQSWLDGARARLDASVRTGDQPAEEVEYLEQE